MLVAVPILDGHVAPRFGFADSFLIGEIAGGRVTRVDRIQVMHRGFAGRLGALRGLGVEVVVCGGFNRAFLPLAEELEMRVLAGVAGEARRAMDEFAAGRLVAAGPCRAARRRAGICRKDER